MTDLAHNMILYGPPGTGKTYNSVIYAVAICECSNEETLQNKINSIKQERYSDVLSRYNEFIKQGRIAFTTFHQSYSYEDFIEGLKPNLNSEGGSISYSLESGIFKKFCEDASAHTSDQDSPEHSKENCVFIIDEINRGNISKIFGELITLIEDSKRAGSSEAITARLPYSKTEFSVPENVYILGTMNTADRSIALMDTALRRRFEFIEMMPDADVLNNLGIGMIQIGDKELNISRMLNVINRRIELLYDREHTIGHAFFTKLVNVNNEDFLDTLASIFKNKIIPLLQEYFYDDYRKIQLVLGDDKKNDEYKFIRESPVNPQDIFNSNPDDIDFPEKKYEIWNEAFKHIESYKSIAKDL